MEHLTLHGARRDWPAPPPGVSPEEEEIGLLRTMLEARLTPAGMAWFQAQQHGTPDEERHAHQAMIAANRARARLAPTEAGRRAQLLLLEMRVHDLQVLSRLVGSVDLRQLQRGLAWEQAPVRPLTRMLDVLQVELGVEETEVRRRLEHLKRMPPRGGPSDGRDRRSARAVRTTTTHATRRATLGDASRGPTHPVP